MIIDSSAVLAVIGKEPGYERIIHELAGSRNTPPRRSTLTPASARAAIQQA